MKVLLISPPKFREGFHTLRDEICFQDVIYVPFPIRLGMVAGLLKADHDVSVIDANALDYSFDQVEEKLPEADLVIIESASGLLAHDLQTFSIVKRKFGPSVKTALIENIVAPVFPERLLNDFPDLDYIVRGQPEVVFQDWMQDWNHPEAIPGLAYRKNGSPSLNPAAALPPNNLDGYPYMHYDAFPMDRYSISYLAAPMYEKVVPGIRFRSTRDCPYACPFCIIQPSEVRGYDRRSFQMSPQRAIDEIEHVINRFHLQGIFFWDETFTINQKRTMAMCDEIIRRGLKFKWRCLTRIDTLNQPLLERMYEAGCRHIEFGLESGDQAVRTHLQKKFPDEKAIEVIHWTQKAGISANCDFIVGMPWETEQTLQKTIDLAKKLMADNIHITMAFPYPETEFHRIAQQEGLLLLDDFYPILINERVRVGAKPWVKSRSLSSDDLYEGWCRARTAVNRHYLVHQVFLSPDTWWRYLKLCTNWDDFSRLSVRAIRSLQKALIQQPVISN
jgi:anaerobic magnesium-protoporphyrin IX monomethyl ester cyclase